MIYLVLSIVWLAVGGGLFFKTNPDGSPVFTLPLGNPPLNGAWMAIALAFYNAVRFYQYTNQRKSRAP